MADVFISYSETGTGGLVRDIANVLEGAGFSCWYAKRDMKPGEFGGVINRAIRECRVFLLILDKAGAKSPHIRNEMALAFRRLTNYEDMALVPFRIDDCDIRDYDGLDYFLTCQKIVDGSPPDREHIQELVQRIARIVRKKRPRAENRVSQQI